MSASPQPAANRQTDFETLYERHSREVWALAYARWMNADVALDIMQEAFLRLWKQWNEGEAILNPRAWLLRVARNLAEDRAKSAFQRNGTSPPQHLVGLPSHEPGSLDALVVKERFAQVRAVLEELSAADRELLTLRYALEKSSAEIAEILGTNTAAVHMRLTRARQRLAERLVTQGVVQNHDQ